MKYYTKEWYHLMQNLNYVTDMKSVPDQEYTEEDIRKFYEEDLAAHVETNTKFYAMVKKSFDLADIIQTFEDSYRIRCEQELKRYPAWVQESVDVRLAALGRLPESVYKRLEEEDKINIAEFTRINNAAREDLDQQDVPDDARYFGYWMSEADVLALHQNGNDVQLYLRKGNWNDGVSPYIRVTFENCTFAELEEGTVLEVKEDENGDLISGCKFLYDEIYKNENGCEVHMMLKNGEELRYLTVGCGDFYFEDGIEEADLQ